MLALSGCGVSYGLIASKDADHGYDEYSSMNSESVEVFPQGKGYKLTDEQAKQYQLPEKQKQQNRLNNGDRDNSVNGSQNSTSNPSLRFNTNRNGTNLNINRTATKDVVIFSDLKTSYKAGTTAEFYIVTKTRNNTTVDNKYVTIKYGNKVLKGKKGDAGKYNYSFEVQEGTVKFEIKVQKTAKNNALNQQRNILGTTGGTADEPEKVSKLTIIPVSTKYTAGKVARISLEITDSKGKKISPNPDLITVKYNSKTYAVYKDEKGYYCNVRIAAGRNPMNISIAKSPTNEKWSGTYTITGKSSEEQYDVEIGSDVPIDGIDAEFAPGSYKCTKNSSAADMIAKILGDYKYRDNGSGYIDRVWGFKPNTTCRLSDDAIERFAEIMEVDPSEFTEADTGNYGRIVNGDFHDGLGWIITDEDGNIYSLNDTVPKGTKLTLVYGVLE